VLLLVVRLRHAGYLPPHWPGMPDWFASGNGILPRRRAPGARPRGLLRRAGGSTTFLLRLPARLAG